MLVWSKASRLAVWCLMTLLTGVIYGLPVAVIALASISGQWNDLLPAHMTFSHYMDAAKGDAMGQLWVSVITGAAASVAALISGTWAALALRYLPPLPKRLLDVLFFIPSAVPSVSIGLGLLVAFSQKPLLLNGTATIVFIAHFLLISAFCYGNVTAGLQRLPPEYEQIAESLGARPFYRLRRVTLPLLMPYLVAALSLSFALSMGELGATVMIYPPGWMTLPVGIFSLSDRGAVFDSATLTMMLGVATLIVLMIFSRFSVKATARK